mmetsp:Transcript_36341/g.87682  ORF Transcript_36341/g.87682 Transcript_36341/m.87682 type:complete len:205 (-) Transcript_36341:214-828(-)
MILQKLRHSCSEGTLHAPPSRRELVTPMTPLVPDEAVGCAQGLFLDKVFLEVGNVYQHVVVQITHPVGDGLLLLPLFLWRLGGHCIVVITELAGEDCPSFQALRCVRCPRIPAGDFIFSETLRPFHVLNFRPRALSSEFVHRFLVVVVEQESDRIRVLTPRVGDALCPPEVSLLSGRFDVKTYRLSGGSRLEFGIGGYGGELPG